MLNVAYALKRFTGYSLFKRAWIRYTGSKFPTASANVGLAMAAGSLNAFTTVPLWAVSTRMTLAKTNKEHYSGVLSAAKTIIRNEGFMSLYKGLLPALMLVSNPAIQFSCYEQLSGRLLALKIVQKRRRLARAAAKLLGASPCVPRVEVVVDRSGVDAATGAAVEAAEQSSPVRMRPPRLTVYEHFVLGAFAKAVATGMRGHLTTLTSAGHVPDIKLTATVATYPIQVVRARLEAGSSSYRGFVDAGSTMLREEGWQVFFQGTAASCECRETSDVMYCRHGS